MKANLLSPFVKIPSITACNFSLFMGLQSGLDHGSNRNSIKNKKICLSQSSEMGNMIWQQPSSCLWQKYPIIAACNFSQFTSPIWTGACQQQKQYTKFCLSASSEVWNICCRSGMYLHFRKLHIVDLIIKLVGIPSSIAGVHGGYDRTATRDRELTHCSHR
jgi:hypothetical protein